MFWLTTVIKPNPQKVVFLALRCGSVTLNFYFYSYVAAQPQVKYVCEVS